MVDKRFAQCKCIVCNYVLRNIYCRYMKNSPEIQAWRRNFYQRTTLHQLTDLLRNLMPTKKFAFGVGASAMDSYGKGQSFFSRLLSFDAANVFQHCGQFPGRFRGRSATIIDLLGTGFLSGYFVVHML